MAKVKLDFGAEIDLLNKRELDDSLGNTAAGWFRELARGVKHVDFPVMTDVVSTGAIVLGGDSQPGNAEVGPREGFVWKVGRISVAGMASGDVVSVYKGSAGNSRFVTNIAAAAPVYHPGGSGLILRSGAFIVVTGTGLMATQLWVTGEADEAPAQMIFKLISG